MNLKEKMQRFKKRWKVVDNKSYENSFVKFRIRILNILGDIDRHVDDASIELFCQHYGIPEKWHSSAYSMSYPYSTNIIEKLQEPMEEIEFYELLQVIFLLNIVTDYGYRNSEEYSKVILLTKVSRAIDFSEINLAISVRGDDVIFHPRGEEKLDSELVDTVLSFLDQESSKHFAAALKEYQKKHAVKSAEGLRRSLEEFLRYKLGNSKGLNANIGELQKRLKQDGRDPQVRNIIFHSFSFLDQYFNEKSKHKDGDISDSENEFLIYQVGLLMRYINSNL